MLIYINYALNGDPPKLGSRLLPEPPGAITQHNSLLGSSLWVSGRDFHTSDAKELVRFPIRLMIKISVFLKAPLRTRAQQQSRPLRE